MSASRSRIHHCKYSTPIVHEFTKQPSWVECTEDGCFWRDMAQNASREELLKIRKLAEHHTRMRKHEVAIHLHQVITLRPREDATS